MIQRRNKQLIRRFYLKEIPVTLNYKTIKNARIIGQFLGIVVLTAIIAFTIFNNITPFGITVKYDLNENTKNISKLGPKNRVTSSTYYGQSVSKITDDLVYFTTNVPFNFDIATVKVIFKNNSPDQIFVVGFQDQPKWHYITKPFDAPFLNNLKWIQNGYQPTLYQRNQTYKSMNDFISNPPHNAIIGTFAFDNDIGDPNVTIPNYKPSSQETVINMPLRGRQVIYAYLAHEPFNMTFEKQDLNWSPNPDTVKITVYKDNDVVFQTTMDDDGITDGSHKVLPPSEITISNPGPGLPESGIYKIVVDANNDTIIKSIKSNLHKIVFANSIFPAGNNKVYKDVIATTSATTVYTNALLLTAITYHTLGEQTIIVGNQSLNLNTLKIPQRITPRDTITKVIIPENDVSINGFQGYFAFSQDQFFVPNNYYIMPVNSSDDLNMVDYLVTEYHPSHIVNGWDVNEQTFDLNNAYLKNGRLSWLIEAPQLKQNDNSLIIKDIQVTFHKKGWLNL